MPTVEQALPHRSEIMAVPDKHHVNGHPIQPPFPYGLELAQFGLGCFWGAERKFWQMDGVFSTAVGYAGGITKNSTYEDVCSGMTGHTEIVLVVYDPQKVTYEELLTLFWESHDPTQGMRQGNDQGTQYRSAIYTYNDIQLQLAQDSKKNYQSRLSINGFSTITTEIMPADVFYYAETFHQQYLAKNTAGYCGLGGTGISCG